MIPVVLGNRPSSTHRIGPGTSLPSTSPPPRSPNRSPAPGGSRAVPHDRWDDRGGTGGRWGGQEPTNKWGFLRPENHGLGSLKHIGVIWAQTKSDLVWLGTDTFESMCSYPKLAAFNKFWGKWLTVNGCNDVNGLKWFETGNDDDLNIQNEKIIISMLCKQFDNSLIVLFNFFEEDSWNEMSCVCHAEATTWSELGGWDSTIGPPCIKVSHIEWSTSCGSAIIRSPCVLATVSPQPQPNNIRSNSQYLTII